MAENLFNKVWQIHEVAKLPNGESQLYIGLHLVHEVTSPQAFAMLTEKGIKAAFPDRTVATVDHIVPTTSQQRPFGDRMAEAMMSQIEKNSKEFGIRFYGPGSGKQGIVHVIGPELGLTQPGMTIACGDSHTSTHGAFGAVAFGIGTSQVRDVLASQCIAISKPKVRKIEVSGKPGKGVYAKDVILKLIERLGVNGGIGFAYEYCGETFEQMSMEERMTVCNMSIEGGARAGYANPDRKTVEFLRGREFSPKGEAFERASKWWLSMASDTDAKFDDIFKMDVSKLEPMVTWGINPGQAIPVTGNIPDPKEMPSGQMQSAQEALEHMGFRAGSGIEGAKIDVAFIGSCTNSRICDLREAAKIVEGRKVAQGVKALVVPGSQQVAMQAQKEGLDRIFTAAGFEWRLAGCSMCLAMNPDKLAGKEMCASSSNRNFKGRQGSAFGRTMLMSPAMVAAAAINGKITDVRGMI
ncbi:MAG TPA: 3-isopropylmalate dehydratase large subunit [Candidatus Diapherotrites archaeon]|uniref:3-isopropylmalate dehydratase n=1 Tax=Candidatus Iainarchaeum sp. TaxID=3101447 RepID=A0A7J4IVD0_9ARCH|nr:3-isopropylmalate dehydratase large subunit [Candidatus Diapherotrites archaeon]